jgi:hypothetical protein
MSRMSEVPVEEIPEVAAFVDVQQRYQAFRESNKAYFEYLDALTAEYTDKFTAASTAVRGRGVSCGPFEKYQVQVTYDADMLYDLVGRDKFLELGGVEKKVTVRSVDKKRVEMFIKSGKLGEEETKAIKKESPRYRSLPELKVP